MNEDEMLMIVVRSSQGFKYNVRLCNQVGIIESDYYNNETNEGHLFIRLQNHGDKDYIVKKGDAICQAIFTKFLTVTPLSKICSILLFSTPFFYGKVYCNCIVNIKFKKR